MEKLRYLWDRWSDLNDFWYERYWFLKSLNPNLKSDFQNSIWRIQYGGRKL